MLSASCGLISLSISSPKELFSEVSCKGLRTTATNSAGWRSGEELQETSSVQCTEYTRKGDLVSRRALSKFQELLGVRKCSRSHLRFVWFYNFCDFYNFLPTINHTRTLIQLGKWFAFLKKDAQILFWDALRLHIWTAKDIQLETHNSQTPNLGAHFSVF